MNRPWVKLYVEALGDAKLRTLPPEQRYCWYGLLMLAGQCGADGHLEFQEGRPYSDQFIADALSVPIELWQDAKRSFEERGMIGCDGGTFVVIHFAERQAPTDPTAAARMQRMRKKAVCNVTPDVTPNVTPDVTRILRVEQNRTEQSTVPPPPHANVTRNITPNAGSDLTEPTDGHSLALPEELEAAIAKGIGIVMGKPHWRLPEYRTQSAIREPVLEWWHAAGGDFTRQPHPGDVVAVCEDFVELANHASEGVLRTFIENRRNDRFKSPSVPTNEDADDDYDLPVITRESLGYATLGKGK